MGERFVPPYFIARSFHWGGNVRTLTEADGTILFCGKDVAEALGYADTINALKQHCRGVVKRHLIDSLGRKQEASFLFEPDLYRLIVASKLPSAQKFERWGDVSPPHIFIALSASESSSTTIAP